MFELLIQSIKNHIELTDAEADQICAAMQVKKTRKNQLLIEPPDYCNSENFIVKGCLRLYFLDPEGVEHTLAFAAEGWWITDLGSFFTGEPAKYHLEALEDGEILVLRKDKLDELFETIPALNIYFRKLYQNSIVALNERLLNVISTTADERYIRFIKKYPALENRLPQYLIASYLGVTPEFLSKIKARIAKR
ncbi:Crp/Fnr family transcriptional regulator [Mucilaginibacter sp. CAU 1740]|uniref:Crp/Fnr family transcriptional regulator n=1 Tax=Mucilaginibacter sp. CAU 1740 TaxID=3140365 RepID=UPI00325C31D9